MKKRLLLIVCCVLVFALCATALISCKPDENNTIDETMLEALLQSAKGGYAESGNVTGNFTVSGTVSRFDEEKDEMVKVNIKWTPSVNSVTTTLADGIVTVIVPESREADLTFTLTATLVDADGNAYKRADGTEYSFTITRTAKETNASMEAANSFYGKIVKDPQVGTAYKAVVFKEYTAWYFAGTTESADTTYRYNTTFKYSESPDVYLEQAEGGYYLYFMNGDVKTYIDIFRYNGNASTGFVTDKTALKGVYTIHETAGCLYGTVKEGDKTYNHYLGMRGQYLPSISAVTDPKPLNDGTLATGYKYTDNPVFLVSEDVSYQQDELTEAQVLAKANALGDNEELAGRYSLTGVVTKVVASTYSDTDVYMTLTLDNTTEIMCYRLTKGSSLHEGDTIRVTGVIKKYKKDADTDAIIEFIAYGHYEVISKAPVQVPSNVDKVTTPAADTAYLIVVDQANLTNPAQIYLLAEMSSYWVATSTDHFKGVKYYVETATDGYKIYRLDNETKKYLGVTTSGTNVNLNLDHETVWKIDADGIHVTIGEGEAATEYYIGTKESYTTVGMYTATQKQLSKAYLGTLKAEASKATITVTEDANATIIVDKTTANIGDTVTITVTPKNDYTIAKVNVNGKEIAAVEGVYSFVVEGNSTVSVVMTDPSGVAPKGSELNPYTAEEAKTAAMALSKGGYSATEVWAIGYVVNSCTYNSKYNSYTFWIADTATGDKLVQVYSSRMGDGINAVGLGDKVLVKGKLMNFNDTTPEFTGASDGSVEYPTVVGVSERADASIEATAADNAHTTIAFTDAEGTKVEGKNGQAVTFTVTVADGYDAETLVVKVNDNTVTANEGTYTVYLSGTMTISTTVELIGADPKGTEGNPYTATEAKNLGLANKAYTQTEVYVRAYVIAEGYASYNTEYKNITLWLSDTANGTQLVEVYRGTLADETKIPYIGDIVLVKGYIQNYNSTIEFTTNNNVKPVITVVEVGNGSIEEATSNEHSTVTFTEPAPVEGVVTAKNGTSVKFTVAVDNDYEVDTVKVGGDPLTAVEGVYTVVLNGNMNVVVAVKKPGTKEEQALATITFTTAELNKQGVADYTSTWDYTCNGTTVTFANFNANKNTSNNTWTYVKAGRKNNDSIASITTKTAIDSKLSSIVITVDAVTSSKINGIYLQMCSNSSFAEEDTTEIQVASTLIVKGEMKIVIPEEAQAENMYYRVVFDCASGSSNGLIQISQIVYMIIPEE